MLYVTCATAAAYQAEGVYVQSLTMSPYPLLLLFLLVSCTQEIPPPQVGFYHWQQRLEMDSLTTCVLDKIGSRELHVKFMDIGWQGGQPVPLSKLDVLSVDTSFRIVPVIFITNEVFRRIRGSAAISELAKNIVDHVGLKFLNPGLSEVVPLRSKTIASADTAKLMSFTAPTEWQIDCDWTESTKGRYFLFLENIKALIGEKAELSATIRLHQFINQSAQGIPPVDRGMLMAYNVGELDDPKAANTILDTLITANYLRPGTEYPLPLDQALPYYQWGRIYRDDELVYLSNELTAAELDDRIRFRLNTDATFTVLQSTYLRGYHLYAGDLIRLEGSEQKALEAVARQLSIIPGFVGQRLLFYHLGSQLGQQCAPEPLLELAKLTSKR